MTATHHTDPDHPLPMEGDGSAALLPLGLPLVGRSELAFELTEPTRLAQKPHAKVQVGNYCGTQVAAFAFRSGRSRAPLWEAALDGLATRILPYPHPVSCSPRIF